MCKKKEAKKEKTLYNIAEFNIGKSSKIIRNIFEEDETALVLKQPIAVIISIDKFRVRHRFKRYIIKEIFKYE